MTDTPVLAASRWPTNADLIVDCVRLGYLRDEDHVLDPTYGLGVWWRQWQPLRLTTHNRDVDGVDFRRLPYGAGTFDAATYDPPYVCIGGRTTSGIPDMHDRYGLTDAPRTPADLQQLINDGLTEMVRVVKARGIVLAKMQDYISSGRLWIGTHHTLTHALDLGCEVVDRLEHVTHPRPQPPGRRQVHARRNLSTLLVLRTPKDPACTPSAHSARAISASTSPSAPSSETSTCVGTPSSTTTPPVSAPTITPTSPTSATSPPSTGQPSSASTSSPPATRASRSAKQGNVEAPPTLDICGPTSPKPFAVYDRASSSWRMCEDTSPLGSTKFSRTLMRSGSMSSGRLYARPMLAPATSVPACSSSLLLPTPTTQPMTGNGHARHLGGEVKHLPTPRARDHKGGDAQPTGGPSLPQAVSLLPTPRTSDTNGPGKHGDGGLDLRTAVTLLPTPRVAATRTSRRAATAKHSRSAPSLEQAIELAQGTLPRELTTIEEAPQSWRGAYTPKPSSDTPDSSDDPHPNQPTTEAA